MEGCSAPRVRSRASKALLWSASASFSRPLALRQSAKLWTEANVEGCSAPPEHLLAGSCSRESSLASSEQPPNAFWQQSRGQDSEQPLRVLAEHLTGELEHWQRRPPQPPGEPHSSALAARAHSTACHRDSCPVAFPLPPSQALASLKCRRHSLGRWAKECRTMHVVDTLFSHTLHHEVPYLASSYFWNCYLRVPFGLPIGREIWGRCTHHAPTRRLHFLPLFWVRPIPLQLLSQGPWCFWKPAPPCSERRPWHLALLTNQWHLSTQRCLFEDASRNDRNPRCPRTLHFGTPRPLGRRFRSNTASRPQWKLLSWLINTLNDGSKCAICSFLVEIHGA